MLSSSCNLQVTKVVPVAQAQPTSAGTAPFSHYTAHLADGTTLSARRVVMAVGSTNIPRIPEWAKDLAGSAPDMPSDQVGGKRNQGAATACCAVAVV
jgi:hypothetical protein